MKYIANSRGYNTMFHNIYTFKKWQKVAIHKSFHK